MSLLLVTAANRPYLERITPYLETVVENGAAFDRRILVSVGCRVEMPEGSPIEPVALPAAQALGHTGNFCVQQGCFLEVLGAADDDVIVFTDGDIRMQGEPRADELAWMRSIPQGAIAVAWNGGSDDTLLNEADRIGMTEAGRALFGALLHRKVYNVGVIVCRAATYRRIYQRYLELWPVFYPETNHYAANQFLMCAVAAEQGLCVWEMHPSVHTHGCFGLPAWAEDRGGELFVDGVPVLFRHHYGC